MSVKRKLYKMSNINKSVMDKNIKSHGKKSDKETHTPMLKLFKDIMQMEMNDQENIKLLNEKNRHRKKNPYTTSRHMLNRSDTSISDVNEMDAPTMMDNRHYDVLPCKTICDDDRCINQHGKGWRRFKNIMPKKAKYRKISEDTSSHRSCALKRLATSEYACLICLGIIFGITILVAILMVYRTPMYTKKAVHNPLSKLFKGMNYETPLKDGFDFDRSDWDDSHLGRINDIPGLPLESDDSNSRGLNFGPNNQFTDLSRIIDINKLNYGKSSQRLKSFYKKLLQTDDQIKNLKKGYLGPSMNNFKNMERRKRSLKHHHIRPIDDLNNNEEEKRNCVEVTDGHHLNGSVKPMTTSVVIQKKQIMLNYPENDKKIVPKCSHVPKESKSHEAELKHPFYKHTQRLDELLDKMLDKNIETIMFDPFQEETFKDDNPITENLKITTEKTTLEYDVTSLKTVSPHKALLQTSPHKPTSYKTATRQKVIGKKHDAAILNSYSDFGGFFKISPTDNMGSSILMGVTTLVTHSLKQKPEIQFSERVPARKLMQAYEEEEGLGYEDFKEVLNDDIEPPEDPEIKADRSRRDLHMDPIPDYEIGKSSPSSVPIPNWKGPFPLYPDELNTMIKQEAKNPAKAPRTPDEPLVNDVDYVEDYLANKYEKLAQAYSDYGVLDEKKPQKSEKSKDGTVNEHRGRSTLEDNNIQIKDSTTQRGFSNFTDENLDGQFDPSEANEETVTFDTKNTDYSDFKPVEATSNESIAGSIKKPFESLKALQTLPKILAKDFLSIQVGSDDDYNKNDDSLITIGYGVDKNKNEISLKSSDPSNALVVLKKLFNVPFKSRSLKSVVDDTEEDIIEVNTNITPANSMIPVSNQNSYFTEALHESTSKNPAVIVNTSLDNVSSRTVKVVNKSGEDNSNKHTKKSILDVVNSVNNRNDTSKNGSGMDLSDLFRMFSSWFSSLASASLDSDNQSETNSSIMVMRTTEAPNDVKDDAKNTSDIIYSNYDTDMIDNIGHRSRVLMAVEEVSNATKDNKESETESEESTKDQDVTSSTELTNTIQTTQKYESDTSTLEEDKKEAENKTVVKRSLTDSGLVFWSDIYDDDEYGIKVDQMDEVNKRSPPKGRDFMKKSKNWFQDKVKSIADNIKELGGDGMKRSEHDDSHPKVFKRQVTQNMDESTERVPSFAELKVKMRSICKEAARAVQQTRKMKARESPEDTASSSIMQQLVRMMSDLVDYQVKQKTCIKLPEDLQNFLEWLIIPNQEQSQRQNKQELGFLDDIGKAKDWEPSIPSDEKTDYLNSLRAVEDLIHQYGQMTDEEKSKMSGVQEYLKNQQDYLTKQLAILDDLRFSEMYANQQPIRIRREITDNEPKLKIKRRRKLKKRPGKYITHHKKTSTVVSFDDVVENAKIEASNHDNDNHGTHRCNDDSNNFNFDKSDTNTKNNQQGNSINDDFEIIVSERKYSHNKEFGNDKIGDRKIEKALGDVVTKRNLQDVYYRAVNEAKKMTTRKSFTN